MSRSNMGKLTLQAKKLEAKLQKYEKRIQKLAQEAYIVRTAQELVSKAIIEAQGRIERQETLKGE